MLFSLRVTLYFVTATVAVMSLSEVRQEDESVNHSQLQKEIRRLNIELADAKRELLIKKWVTQEVVERSVKLEKDIKNLIKYRRTCKIELMRAMEALSARTRTHSMTALETNNNIVQEEVEQIHREHAEERQRWEQALSEALTTANRSMTELHNCTMRLQETHTTVREEAERRNREHAKERQRWELALSEALTTATVIFLKALGPLMLGYLF